MNRQEDRMPHSEQFMPETVDEQIEQFSRLPEAETVNGHLINDLHIVCKEYIERRDRIWARIEAQMRDHSSAEQLGIITSSLPASNFAGGKRNTQQRHFSFSRLRSRRTPLELIAAVLVAVLIVGSMLWLVAVTHPFTGGTIVASRPTAQISSKPVISGQGIVYPNQELDIQYPTSITVKAVFVQAGYLVKPGQALIQLDPVQLASQIVMAQAKLKATQNYLKQLKANGGSAAQIVSAQQQVNLAQSNLAQLQQEAKAGNVTSPIAGLVTQVNVNAGQTVAANTVLLTVMDESTVVVHAKVPLTFMGKVHKNQVATVTTSALSGYSVRGVVTSIILLTDPRSHTFEVWVSVPNTGKTSGLLAGMSAHVQIQMK
jgi:multidrug efflux pump subunit AcrA (membrane-fusion protein)